MTGNVFQCDLGREMRLDHEQAGQFDESLGGNGGISVPSPILNENDLVRRTIRCRQATDNEETQTFPRKTTSKDQTDVSEQMKELHKEMKKIKMSMVGKSLIQK